jgi:CheY-like chemotaxis protein
MKTQVVNSSIMVIGFDTYFCYLMRRYVRMVEHQLVFANRGEDALTQARDIQPCAIILEVEQTGNLSWTTLKALKSDQITSHIPIVICSWQDEEQHSKQEGADYYLHLPVMYEHFKLALENVGAIA